LAYQAISEGLSDLLATGERIRKKLRHQRNISNIWSKSCTQAFEVLKTKLTHTPVLGYPDFQKPFCVDASLKGFGAW
jgi:hypothetical protein